MNKDTGVAIAALAGATALVVGMGLADNGTPVVSNAASLSARQMPRAVVEEKLRESGEEEEREAGKAREAENESLDGPAQQQYDQRAYPRGYISSTRTNAARQAYASLPEAIRRSDFRRGTTDRAEKANVTGQWDALGPVNPVVPGDVTYTGRQTTNSGRITALAIDPACTGGDCRLWVAAAGGGIWRTDDATAATPTWTALDNGLTTNTFGSLVIDPNDLTGNTLYAGSGEPSGSSDSEAGLGLFKTTDGGNTWELVPGSYPVAKDRSIAAIVIDPTDPSTIWIGTALARHGSSSANGGRRTPPGAPAMGIYRSTDGGDFFSLEFSKPGDGVNPATGTDYFTGGVRRLVLDPAHPTQLYASIMGYGIYRLNNTTDPDAGTWNEIYRSQWGANNFDGNLVDPSGSFTDFDLANVAGATRIYVGDTSDEELEAILLRADGIDTLSSSALLAAEDAGSAPWVELSDSSITNPDGYSSYYWCQNGQCGYDSFVKVDPTDADTVWLGGAMNYDELSVFGGDDRSNGRAVVRSTDAGVSFTDMTNDNRFPPLGMHPDQRALVFNPTDPGQAFIGSDGGLVRTNGVYEDQSADPDQGCAARGLTGDELAFCNLELSSVPQRIDSLDVGLNTLQFQSLTASAGDPYTDVIGGTQDNGTWAWDGSNLPTAWFESVGGDGGQSGISDAAGTRMHTYYGTSGDVNFNGNDPLGWNYVTGPIDYSGESSSFYVPMISDPTVPGTYFMGAESVWRTTDSGGDQATLETQCNELSGSGPFDDTCGDWVTVGSPLAPFPSDYIVALGRTSGDDATLWAGLRFGDLFVSQNADAAPVAVSYDQIDTPQTPGRFVSGIQVDPKDPNHAWISYSGYGAYTPGQPGHVFEAMYDPGTATASFTDRSYDLGDQPVTGIGVDWLTGDVYASTDFGVTRLPGDATAWSTAAEGLPPVATYGLTLDPQARTLYAATHGRGAYRLPMDPAAVISGPTNGEVGTALTFQSTGSAGYQGESVEWTFPDGTTSQAPTASYTPTQAGAQEVQLVVTDQLGHSTMNTLVVSVVDKPTGALNPTFGKVTSTADGFTAPISNYDPLFVWTATATSGSAVVSDSGVLTVTGLKPGKSSTVTVTTMRDGYPQGSGSVSGSAQKRCSLTVKAKKKSYKLPKSGTVKVVKKAKTTGSCSVSSVVKASPLGKKGSTKVKTKRGGNGSLTVTTYADPVKVSVTYTAKSSKKSVSQATWSRDWKTK